MSNTDSPSPGRGFSNPSMRRAECKDCAREVRAGTREAGTEFFLYPEAWAGGQLDRGGSRTDRCREHRQKHQKNIAGMAVAYIDLATVGQVDDPTNPAGPLGGLGPLPGSHDPAATGPVDLGTFGFGMDESHITTILESLADNTRRVMIVKAGTGTGKSTYMPYRLLDPPGGCFRLADLGPIVVTEPRVQATTGVAEFVGEKLSGAGGVGPGYPVGFQVSGNKQHDTSCQLVFVTDGTMINWMREGRLSQIGTVIVDEAHERSTNIDFIMGYLKRELPRYPHLRVIVTSATFNADFYQQYFGGPTIAGKIDIPAVKSIGYGWPLFPDLDVMLPEEAHHAERWTVLLPQLPLASSLDEERLIREAWPQNAPPLKEDEVRDPSKIDYVEDLHATTAKLMRLRFKSPIPTGQWMNKMPEVLGRFVVELALGLDREGTYGDILGFLPTGKNIEEACGIIQAGVGDRADVFALLSSLPEDEKKAALDARQLGDRRKIVISTNLAETSLTVEGVRFVVDSGLIAQSEWNPTVAQGGIKTKAHSQAGIRQRWGRVGRKAPGWVFPLYTKGQLIELAEDTDPGSTRDNLEQLIMTAKLGGIDDVVGFDWPAKFLPDPPVVLEEAALAARDTFLDELERANQALKTSGAIDPDGHPTGFGKELTRFSALGSAACAVAIMYADRLACVPEVAMLLALLYEKSLAGPNSLLLDRPDWPDEWRLESAERHRALASACEDDAELVLQICAGWERADPSVPPWEPSAARRRWAARWWVSDDALRKAAEARKEILAALSPAMKEEVKRFVEPSLLQRARGVISRAFPNLRFDLESGVYRGADDGQPATVEHSSLLVRAPESVIPLTRRTSPDGHRISNLVTFERWAAEGTGDAPPTGVVDIVRLLSLSAKFGRPDQTKDVLGSVIEAWPAGSRVQLTFASASDAHRVEGVLSVMDPPLAPFSLPEDVPVVATEDSEDETDEATVLDAAPELDTSWPTHNDPLPDEDSLALRAVLDPRDVEAREHGCGSCAACLAGTPSDCEQPQVEDDDTGVEDALAEWRERATVGIDASRPLVRIGGAAPEAAGWYEVVGYTFAPDGEPVIDLAPDWRPVGESCPPGAHPDLAPGDLVEVVVGGRARDHRDAVRILWRADGRGRFVVREAHTNPVKQDELGQVAASLFRRRIGQVDALIEGALLLCAVLPRKEPECLTVTLLELARQHFDASHPADGPKFTVELKNGPREVPFYPATVASDPNSAGYVEVKLLARDSSIGLVHGASIPVAEGAEPPPVGTPLLVRLAPEIGRLPLRGVPLLPVRQLADRERSISLPLGSDDAAPAAETEPLMEVGPDGGEAPPAEPQDDVEETGTYDSVLLSHRPVPRHVAMELSGLRDDAEWRAAVWRFWAKSRYVRSDATEPHPGVTSDPVEVTATVRREVPPAPQLSLEEAIERYPLDTGVEATVTSVSASGDRAWLTLPDGTNATVVKAAVGPTGVNDLRQALIIGNTYSGTITSVGEHKNSIQVHLEFRDLEIAAGPSAMEAAIDAYPPGMPVHATVRKVSDEHARAWLELDGGMAATVAAADVGRSPVVKLSLVLESGEEVDAVVRQVGEQRGSPQVQLVIPDVAVPPLLDQLTACGIVRGAVVDAVVRNVHPEHGLFVQLLRGLSDGLIRKASLPGGSVAGFERNDAVRVEITSVSEHSRQPGKLNIDLRLIERL